MYKINDKVMYLSKKILVIADIIEKDFGNGNPAKYYVLKDINEESNAIYLPVDSAAVINNIRPLLTKAMINKAIDESKNIVLEYETSYKERINKYNEVIKEKNVAMVISLVRLLIEKKNELLIAKKTLSNVDANTLQEFTKAITDEFSYVLGIPKEEVLPYIEKRTAKTK